MKGCLLTDDEQIERECSTKRTHNVGLMCYNLNGKVYNQIPKIIIS